ncbi:hypothetical protein QJR60_09180 [Paraclostridium sordellii]|uniref:hypothetical protein n=1 Tax=Paraclostridium sordellii TaxID=1505 RepID=UPI0030CB8C31
MLKLIIIFIVSIIILNIAYAIGIKKRLSLISLIDEKKLENKTEEEINKASTIMGLGYLIIFILFIAMHLLNKFSIVALILLVIDILGMCIYIYKIF